MKKNSRNRCALLKIKTVVKLTRNSVCNVPANVAAIFLLFFVVEQIAWQTEPNCFECLVWLKYGVSMLLACTIRIAAWNARYIPNASSHTVYSRKKKIPRERMGNATATLMLRGDNVLWWWESAKRMNAMLGDSLIVKTSIYTYRNRA